MYCFVYFVFCENMLQYYLLSLAITLRKQTPSTNDAHSQSSLTANHLVVVRNKNQASECRFWWLSNSSMKVCSALKALIVERPCNEALRCENTGLRAGNNFWSMDNNYK